MIATTSSKASTSTISSRPNLGEPLSAGRAVEVFVQIGPLMMALFLAWCALQRRAGRLALLASPRVTLIGFICFGAFAGCFVLKLVLRHTTLLA